MTRAEKIEAVIQPSIVVLLPLSRPMPEGRLASVGETVAVWFMLVFCGVLVAHVAAWLASFKKAEREMAVLVLAGMPPEQISAAAFATSPVYETSLPWRWGTIYRHNLAWETAFRVSAMAQAQQKAAQTE